MKCIAAELCKAVMRAIGRHKCLWFVVKILDGNKI